MDDNFSMISDRWQDWVTVFGYIAFTVFIVWVVFTRR